MIPSHDLKKKCMHDLQNELLEYSQYLCSFFKNETLI